MPKFRVTREVTISVNTLVETETPDEAKEIALDRELQTLPYNIGGDRTQEWVTSGELDGDVDADSLTVEEDD